MLTINLSLCLHNSQSHRTRLGGCCRVRCGCIEHPYLKKALAGHARCAWNRCLRSSRVCTEAVAVSNPCSSKSLSFYGKAYHTCNSQQHASEALQPPPDLLTTHQGWLVSSIDVHGKNIPTTGMKGPSDRPRPGEELTQHWLVIHFDIRFLRH